jgi:hypothetical protein
MSDSHIIYEIYKLSIQTNKQETAILDKTVLAVAEDNKEVQKLPTDSYLGFLYC